MKEDDDDDGGDDNDDDDDDDDDGGGDDGGGGGDDDDGDDDDDTRESEVEAEEGLSIKGARCFSGWCDYCSIKGYIQHVICTLVYWSNSNSDFSSHSLRVVYMM